MRSLRKCITHLTVAALLLAPALAVAAEQAGEGGGGAHEAGNPWLSLGYKALNFAILLAILFKFLKKPVGDGLRGRADGVRQQLEDARAAKAAAEAKYAEYKQRVANLEQEIQALRAEFRAEGERQTERIAREGQEAAAAVARNAEAAGQNEVKRAKDELRTEVAELAVRLAEEILTRAYTAEDQKKAVRQTIENVERLH